MTAFDLNTGHQRITLDMNSLDIIQVMSEGNPGAVTVCVQIIQKAKDIDPENFMPGAVTVCVQIIQKAKDIDPENFMPGISHLMLLDTFGIYGSRIWMLYKDVCGQNLTTTLAVLRAAQLGLIRVSALNHAIDNRGQGIDPGQARTLVASQVPGFVLDKQE